MDEKWVKMTQIKSGQVAELDQTGSGWTKLVQLKLAEPNQHAGYNAGKKRGDSDCDDDRRWCRQSW